MSTNPDKAQTLLEEAGWTKGSDGIYEKDGQKLSFAIKCPTNDQNRVKLGEMAATYLKTIGVDASAQPTEWATMNGRYRGRQHGNVRHGRRQRCRWHEHAFPLGQHPGHLA